MKLAILTAGDGSAWEERLLTEFAVGAHPVQIVRRCVDVVDLLAVAASGQGRVALVSADLRNLDVDALDRLRAVGVVPIAVVGRDDGQAHESVSGLGISHVLPDDADVGVVASVIVEAVRSASDEDPASGSVPTAHAFADPATSMAAPPRPSDVVPSEPVRSGSVIAIWGPTGAPGRTTVAVALADELAGLGLSTLVVDADVYGGAIAAVLGLLDESPGLAAACRQASAHRLTLETLAALCWQVHPKLRVLTGLPLASRWPELRPAGLESVLAAARGLADFTVVDCGFCLETDEELSFDTIAPRRNGATLTVLDDADTIVAVGTADAIGMQRLVRGLADLRDTEVSAPVSVVLNRVRADAVPGDPQQELTAALHRFTGYKPAALLPADGRAVDQAVAGGRTLRESSPGSPFRQAVIDFAREISGVAAPARLHRRRR